VGNRFARWVLELGLINRLDLYFSWAKKYYTFIICHDLLCSSWLEHDAADGPNEVTFCKRTKSNSQKDLQDGGAGSANAITRDWASNRLTGSKGFDRQLSPAEG
jgi:hypothetical protein